ncbi:DUF2271 domain-containing protein [Undibacterium sp. Ji42W]|uniref:DUF2271 domain-containing protein n=1 Tax=Undibacterium sp. Ji42W TaxID=3413039 RepID=UPI003BEF9B63
MRKLLPFAITSLLGVPALNAVAADLTLKVEVPRLNVAEYHKPYVAIWLEKPDQTFAGNLAVWYDLKKRDNEGTKWLKDMRQWWRRSGRELQMPVEGVSGATRTTGEQTLSFASDKGVLAKLPAGDYQLIVEAAREGGGREVVKVPFQWQAKGEQNLKAQGTSELGAIAVTIK